MNEDAEISFFSRHFLLGFAPKAWQLNILGRSDVGWHFSRKRSITFDTTLLLILPGRAFPPPHGVLSVLAAGQALFEAAPWEITVDQMSLLLIRDLLVGDWKYVL